MTIKDYRENPTTSGYRGIRVTLCGEQHYFKADQMKQAIACHNRLLKKYKPVEGRVAGRHLQDYNYEAKRYDPPRRTGIVGINMDFQEQLKCNPPKHYPAFALFTKSPDGGYHTTSRKITTSRDLTDTWREGCQWLTKMREYKRVPRGWYAKCPSVADFEKLRRWYCHNGRDIHINNMMIFEGERA